MTDAQLEHLHIWGRWFPLDRNHVRRQCVHPSCLAVEVKDVSKS